MINLWKYYIRILNISLFPERVKSQLSNISSVVRASVDLSDDYYCSDSVGMMVTIKDFLENFKHINDLHVGRLFFEFLSAFDAHGWQLPQFRLQHLTIDSSSGYGISGIISMLKSSPDLETLLLDGLETEGGIHILDPAEKCNLDGDLLHLKKIRVNNFTDPNGEPLLTLARILLRRAPALEEMMIVIDVREIREFIKISQTLLTYSRSSPKAEIHLSHSDPNFGC